MSVIFVRPLPFTAATTSPQPLGGSVAELNNDQAGLGWRFGLAGAYLIVDLGASPAPYNYVGLFGSNLRASDTVTIQTGTTTAGTGGYAGTAQPAYIGLKDEATTTKTIIKLPTLRAERYVRIDLTGAGHPDGFLQFTRLVIGSAVANDGIEIGAKQSFDTQTIVYTGPGWRSIDRYGSLDAWKVSTAWIKDTDWRANWAPLLRYASAGNGLMFIANDSTPENWQSDALFGFFDGTTEGSWDGSNVVRFETRIIAYGR